MRVVRSEVSDETSASIDDIAVGLANKTGEQGGRCNDAAAQERTDGRTGAWSDAVRVMRLLLLVCNECLVVCVEGKVCVNVIE